MTWSLTIYVRQACGRRILAAGCVGSVLQGVGLVAAGVLQGVSLASGSLFKWVVATL